MNSKNAKQLVIFGCGYVGSALAQAAQARGMRVTALTRNVAKAAQLREAGVEVVVGDLAEAEWHRQVPSAPDFAVNCVSSGGGGIEGYRRSYVEGMASIVTWARRHGPVGTFLYTGSTSVYPQGDGRLVDELAPTEAAGEREQLLLEAESLLRGANGDVADGTTRSETEQEGTRRQSQCWRRWFILRLAGIYGPERAYLIDQIRSGEVSGLGAHHLNLIHRDDAVAAVLACLEAPDAIADEIFNVADDGPAPKEAIVAWLAGRLGLPSPGFTGQPVGQRRSVTPDRRIGNAKLRGRLGWEPRYPTFREGYASLLSR